LIKNKEKIWEKIERKKSEVSGLMIEIWFTKGHKGGAKRGKEN